MRSNLFDDDKTSPPEELNAFRKQLLADIHNELVAFREQLLADLRQEIIGTMDNTQRVPKTGKKQEGSWLDKKLW